MTANGATLQARRRSDTRFQVGFTADAALSKAVAFWFLAALAGQWAFLYYIAAFYGVSTLTGDLEVWNRLGMLGRSPYVVGDTAGNLRLQPTRSEPA